MLTYYTGMGTYTNIKETQWSGQGHITLLKETAGRSMGSITYQAKDTEENKTLSEKYWRYKKELLI